MWFLEGGVHSPSVLGCWVAAPVTDPGIKGVSKTYPNLTEDYMEQNYCHYLDAQTKPDLRDQCNMVYKSLQSKQL